MVQSKLGMTYCNVSFPRIRNEIVEHEKGPINGEDETGRGRG